jgi:cobalt/nickel transport system permease protein
MTGLPFFKGGSAIHCVDPRPRFVVALAYAIIVSLSRDPIVMISGLLFAAVLCVAAGLTPAQLHKRLLGMNLFMLMLFLVLPLTTPGSALVQAGPLSWSAEGLILAGKISLKANGIMLCYSALVSTMPAETLGHALHKMRLPEKLAQLLVFTVRYVGVAAQEMQRLRRAMKARGFVSRCNRHTFRSYGNLIGMMLVRSFDRSDRIMAAMKCRGFKGRFYVLEKLALGGSDVIFMAAAFVMLLTLSWVELL